MNVGQMIKLLQSYVDDTVDAATAVPWFNAGQNRMAIEVDATFPDLIADGGLTSTPVYPAKFHELPVLYAAAMYKGQDSSRMERSDYLNDFYSALPSFVKGYSPELRYRDDDLTQQFTATAGQTDFVITKNEFESVYGDLQVYVNDKRTTDYTLEGSTFTLSTPAAAGDAVTALWEIHSDFTEPPYSWWKW